MIVSRNMKSFLPQQELLNVYPQVFHTYVILWWQQFGKSSQCSDPLKWHGLNSLQWFNLTCMIPSSLRCSFQGDIWAFRGRKMALGEVTWYQHRSMGRAGWFSLAWLSSWCPWLMKPSWPVRTRWPPPMAWDRDSAMASIYHWTFWCKLHGAPHPEPLGEPFTTQLSHPVASIWCHQTLFAGQISSILVSLETSMLVWGTTQQSDVPQTESSQILSTFCIFFSLVNALPSLWVPARRDGLGPTHLTTNSFS